MLRKVVTKYLLRLTDAEFARFVGGIKIVRQVRRDGLEQSKNVMTISTIAFGVEFIKEKQS